MPDALTPPPSVIASWPEPNFVNPETKGPALEYICIIFSTAAFVFVLARLYARVFITRAPGWDDLLIVVGLVLSIAMCAMIVVGNKLYFSGRHIWDVPPSTFTPHRLNVWITELLLVLAGTAIKISVLLFYRRLSVKFSKVFLVATWIGIVYNILYTISFILTLLLICSPVEASWQSFNRAWASTHKFECANSGASIPAAVGLSVLGDFYSTLLPLLLIFTLRLPVRQKLALYGLFALGFLACAIGVVRVVLLDRLLNRDFDFTWNLWDLWIWSVTEMYVAIFAASAPALKPFFQRFFIDSFSSLAKYSGRRGDTDDLTTFTDASSKHFSSSQPDEAPMDPERVVMEYEGHKSDKRDEDFLNSDAGTAVDGRETAHKHAGNVTSARNSPEHWPISPPPSKPLPQPPAVKSRPSVASRGSKQTIRIGLQIEPETHPLVPAPLSPASRVPAPGSVKAARLRADEQMKAATHVIEKAASADILNTNKPLPKVNPFQRLSLDRGESVKGVNKPTWSPTMQSRDFDSERKEHALGRRDGYMI